MEASATRSGFDGGQFGRPSCFRCSPPPPLLCQEVGSSGAWWLDLAVAARRCALWLRHRYDIQLCERRRQRDGWRSVNVMNIRRVDTRDDAARGWHWGRAGGGGGAGAVERGWQPGRPRGLDCFLFTHPLPSLASFQWPRTVVVKSRRMGW
jgi:hypothetical protein